MMSKLVFAQLINIRMFLTMQKNRLAEYQLFIKIIRIIIYFLNTKNAKIVKIIICFFTPFSCLFCPTNFQCFPEKLCRIKYFDKESIKQFVFLINNFSLTALQVTMLGHHRRKIKLFFKWINQQLKAKSFWDHSENAIKAQVYVAIITFKAP